MSKVMNAGLQKANIIRLLKNRGVEPDLIDIDAMLDPSLSYPENRDNIMEQVHLTTQDFGEMEEYRPELVDSCILGDLDSCKQLQLHFGDADFDKDVLDKSVAIYIDAPFEVCWERNVARHQKAVKAGADDHLVSKEEMEKTYLHDDGKELPGNVALPVEIVDNSKDDLNYLNTQIEKIVQLLKDKYSN